MILERIIQSKKEEIAARKALMPLDSFQNSLPVSKRNFKASLQKQTRPALIAEIKAKSPSAGKLRRDFDFNQILDIYNRHPLVDAISVLTDTPFFGAKLDDLRQAANNSSKPILRKDFIIDPYQIYESRLYGADAILLIARLLSRLQITEFIHIANILGMDCLIEIHHESEIPKIPQNVPIIGINNRNLDTLKIDLNQTLRLSQKLRPRCEILVAESGIHSRQDVHLIRPFADAMLIGSSLLKSENINRKIEQLFSPAIKICGITNSSDARQAAKFGADYLGFIFYPQSRRFISLGKAAEIMKNIRQDFPNCKMVGVFVNETSAKVQTICDQCQLDYIQLHGDEPDNYIHNLDTPVIKAFRIRDQSDIKRVNQSIAQRVLLDSWSDSHYGGTGRRFDWKLLKNIEKPLIFLAGGITPENFPEVKKLYLFAIDISSGIEKYPGKKDRTKLKQLFTGAL